MFVNGVSTTPTNIEKYKKMKYNSDKGLSIINLEI